MIRKPPTLLQLTEKDLQNTVHLSKFSTDGPESPSIKRRRSKQYCEKQTINTRKRLGIHQTQLYQVFSNSDPGFHLLEALA
ncbi:uncharacterized protein BYT42DRAFT_589061 [Radiomyces spectabilis]|uniref:uncharacterized protein n=1 Tax=Radiomyces spectabilis TaxID=64574 RepID=UPI00221F32DD|nr:uncharacterized protein BYT42DRAFT_589061 [Radiomyces spectabilis]KAI8365176.1 hypothetical protein BYT42DRAFT_589061 [Radiomyces spectabilis]